MFNNTTPHSTHLTTTLASHSLEAITRDTALEHFLASNRLVPNRNVVYNIARAYEQLSRYADAHRAYTQALDGETCKKVVAAIKARIQWVYTLLEYKYYMDAFNERVLAAGARLLGTGLWKGGDQALIDGVLINGSARAVGGLAQLTRLFQTGYLYFYALVMLLGVFALMTWQLWPQVRGLFGL